MGNCIICGEAATKRVTFADELPQQFEDQHWREFQPMTAWACDSHADYLIAEGFPDNLKELTIR